MTLMSVCLEGKQSQDTEFLTSKEAAAFLKISEGQLRNLTSQGKIPYYKFQHLNRYKKTELIKLIEMNPKGGRCDHSIRRK